MTQRDKVHVQVVVDEVQLLIGLERALCPVHSARELEILRVVWIFPHDRELRDDVLRVDI